MKFRKFRNARRLTAVGAVLMLSGPFSHAGGLVAATTAATAFSVWSVGIVAVLATIYLLYEGVKCWTGRGDWVNDFGVACIKVAITGSVAGVLVPYLWGLFGL